MLDLKIYIKNDKGERKNSQMILSSLPSTIIIYICTLIYFALDSPTKSYEKMKKKLIYFEALTYVM